MTDRTRITQHYEQRHEPHAPSLTERLAAALAEAGFDAAAPRVADLAALDQFHSRGLAATVELAGIVPLDAGTRVLDVGSGLGGPSRYLASTFGCRVSGIDLSAAFVDAARYLAQRCGLDAQVDYRCADALALPFGDGEFDVAWTQHVAMNIADRDALYREVARVLRPGGHFAVFDVIAGPVQPLHFPVPWASSVDESFLLSAARMRDVLEAQGFSVVSWDDTTDAGLAWFEERARKQAQAASPPPLGLHVVMGKGFRDMTGNLVRNLREGRAALLQAVLRKA